MKKSYIYTSILILASIILACSDYSGNLGMNRRSDNTSNEKALRCDVFPSEIPKSIGLPLASTLPGSGCLENDICKDSMIHVLQTYADTFSWQTFIAMNWLADENGNPDASVCFGEEGNTVWEHWMPASHIYRKDGKSPLEWRDGTTEDGNPLNSDLHKDLRFLAKTDDFSNLTAEDAAVIDQEKKYTLFEIFYNRSAYDYVVNSGLYSKEGQKSFVQNWPDFTSGMTVVYENGDTMNIQKQFKRAYFPVGNLKDSIEQKGDKTFYFTINPGAMIIKSAWRPLPEEEADLYHTRQVSVSEDSTIHLGLVGLHFIHKVSESTQWVWSTFEHKNNAPFRDSTGAIIIEDKVNYAYFDKTDLDSSKFNKPSHSKYEQDINEREPTQVVHQSPIYAVARDINEYFHQKIRQVNPQSVWLNYQLVGTQWPFNPAFFEKGSDYQPAMLANAVMETFMLSKSSCMDCHSQARFLEGSDQSPIGFSSDFVFTLNNAQ